MDLSKIFDKPMKIFICITLIFMTILCIFNNFCFASVDEIPEDFKRVIADVYLSGASIGAVRVVATPGSTMYRVKLDYGANYIMINTPYYLNYFLSNSETYSAGDTVDVPITQLGNNTTTYIYNNGDFKYLYFSRFPDNNVSVYTNANKMNSAITGLVDSLSPSSLWGVFNNAIPYISIVVVAGFGFYYLFHMIKEISQGKEKM